MLRSHTCGELRLSDIDKQVQLTGWVQRTRDLGAMTFIDLRDRYGITQLVVNPESNAELGSVVRELGREYVIRATGKVTERSSKNAHIPTGDVEVVIEKLEVLNPAELPPFTIEDETDGGEDLRMKYRYLDLRRNPLRKNLQLRHRIGLEVRKFLDSLAFMEVETPNLIKSTPEGARDFVVPSRMHPGHFYALPQSPQTFKQLLMVSGYDRYYQIVRCFRDEDLRADRQPEFTQIDCEMSFVEQEDVLNTFEAMVKHLFKVVLDREVGDFQRMPYAEAMRLYGSDKPDLRFGMAFNDLTPLVRGKGFKIFDEAETVLGIVVANGAAYSRKQLDAFTNYVKRPQVGAKGMVYVKYNEDGTVKSSVDKFYAEGDLQQWLQSSGAQPGDALFVLSGALNSTRKQLNELRLHVAEEQGLRDPDTFVPLWVTDFPLLEWDEESRRYHAMHHPFTSPKDEDRAKVDSDPGSVRANAYDLVINGVEIGGGSIRIHDRELQQKMFRVLGFSEAEAQKQFGFLMSAFQYGAPPHGGIAFGFDRLCALFAGKDSIRDFIAFPKNNAGRDIMIDAPATLSPDQLQELYIQTTPENQLN